MSIELYRQITGREELYNLIREGLEAINQGEVFPLEDAMADVRQELASHGV